MLTPSLYQRAGIPTRPLTPESHQTTFMKPLDCVGLQAAVLGVPFVDALTTERDPTLPLTVGEWEEWGAHSHLIHFLQSRCFGEPRASHDAAGTIHARPL